MSGGRDHSARWPVTPAGDPTAPRRSAAHPTRIAYFDSAINSRFLDRPVPSTRVLVIGRPDGLVCAAMSALGYDVTDVDPVAVADGVVDVVVVSGVLERLPCLPSAIAEISRVLRAGGLLLFDTVNRTAASCLPALLGLGDWATFIRPGRLRAALAERDITLAEIRGLVRPPHKVITSVLRGRGVGAHELSNSVRVRYIGHAVKHPARPSAVR